MAKERIAKEYKGKTEVEVFGGRADVLSKKYLVEVKMALEWKSGIGQLYVYSFRNRELKKRLHLIGIPSPDAQSFCDENGISLTWE